jgi:ATP-dependent Lon protease
MEFYDVHFSYIDKETLNEEYVSVPEQGGKLIPEGMGNQVMCIPLVMVIRE